MVEITKFTCNRCGYVWIPRKEDVRNCPHCNSPYWNKQRTRKIHSPVVNNKD